MLSLKNLTDYLRRRNIPQMNDVQDKFGLFWPSNFEIQTNSWLRPIQFCEISAVIGYPASDRQRRLLGLQLNRPDIRWINLDFRTDPIHEPQELVVKLMQLLEIPTKPPFTVSTLSTHLCSSSKKTIICFMGAEQLLIKSQLGLLLTIIELYRRAVIGQILFFDTPIYDSSYAPLIDQLPGFEPRLSYLSLYDRNNCQLFINYLERKWQRALPPALVSDLLTQCGGFLAYLKEAVWFWINHQDVDRSQIFAHPEMTQIGRSIWSNLTSPCQTGLINLLLHRRLNIIPTDTLDYLNQIGLISQNQINSPLFADYILHTQHSNQQLRCQNQTITLNQVPLNNQLSRIQHRLLSWLITHPNQIISRDQLIAQAWSAPDLVSDWALDNQINRLRLRLADLGINPRLLVTQRGQGYLWKQ